MTFQLEQNKNDDNKKEEQKIDKEEKEERNEPQLVKIQENLNFPPDFNKQNPLLSQLKQQYDLKLNDLKQQKQGSNPQETQVSQIKSQIGQQRSLLEKLDLNSKIQNCEDDQSVKSRSSLNSVDNQSFQFVQEHFFQAIPKFQKQYIKDNINKQKLEIDDNKNLQNKHSNQEQQNINADLPLNEENIDQSEQQYQNYKNNILKTLVKEEEKQGGLIKMPFPSQILLQKGGLSGLNIINKETLKTSQIDIQNQVLQQISNNQNGEIISKPQHTYNSIGQLAQNIVQDENLSLNINSKNAKIFYNPNKNSFAKNLICFVENNQDNSIGQKQNSGVKNGYISNNISLLVNQNDQIPNILSQFHQNNKLQGNILDFTIRKFRYLYLLYAKSIVVIDIKDLILPKQFSSQNDIKIIDCIQLSNQKTQVKDQQDQGKNDQNQSHQFSCIEVAGDKQESLLLFTQVASKSYSLIKQDDKASNKQDPKILHIYCSSYNDSHINNQYQDQISFGQSDFNNAQSVYVQTYLQINSTNSKANFAKILDVHVWDSYLAVLFEKSQILVYDFKDKSKFENPVFRASYADTDQITQIFYIKDFTKVQQKKGEYIDFNNEKQISLSKQNSSQDSIENIDLKENFLLNNKLQGHFLLIETKQKNSKSQSEKTEKFQNFRKLHIVQIQDTIGGISIIEDKKLLKGGSPKRVGNQSKQNQQSLYQIDKLTFTETQQKFVSFDGNRGIVFLMNNELQDRNIRLFTIKLKKQVIDDSDSDDNSNMQSLYRIRFEYITEVKLKLSNQSFSAIQQVITANSSNSKQPQYLLVLNSSQEDNNIDISEDYFVYTNIHDQVIVFERPLTDMIPSSIQMVKVISQKNKNPVSPMKILNAIPNQIKNGLNLTDDDEQKQQLQKSVEKEKENSESSSKMNDNIEQFISKILKQDQMQNQSKQNNLLDQNLSEEEKIILDQEQEIENQKEIIDNKAEEILQEKVSKVNQKKEKNKAKKKEEKKAQNKANTSLIDEDIEAQVKQKPKKEKNQTQQQQVNNNIPSTNQTQQQQQKKNQKQQESNIIENFEELTKKYHELATKTNQLQQLLAKQQQQKVDVESAIKKAVQEQIGDKLIGEQLRDTVVPMLTSKILSVGDFVHANVLPKIEKQIEQLFNSYIENEQNFQKKQSSQVLNPQAINKLIQKEFKNALENDILPELEKSIKHILESLDKKLNQIDVALCEKLSDEDERWKEMQNNYNNSLQWLKLFHKKMGGMAQEMIRQQIVDQANNSKAIMAQQMKQEINIMMQTHLKQEIQAQVAQQVQKQMQSNYYPQYQQQYMPQQPPFQNMHSPSQLGIQPQMSNLEQRMKYNQSYQYPTPNQLYENPNHVQSFYSQDQYSFTNKDQDQLYRENLLLKKENEKQKMELLNFKQQLNTKQSQIKIPQNIQQHEIQRKEAHPLDSFITQSKKVLTEEKKFDRNNQIFEELQAERGYEEEEDFDDAEYGKDQYLQNFFNLNKQETGNQNRLSHSKFSQEISEKNFGKYYDKAEQLVNDDDDEDYIEAGTKYMKDTRVKQFNDDNPKKQPRRQELNRYYQ